MRDYQRQARAALEAYLSRGIEALDSAKAFDVDRVNHLMTLRRAAFHNFRVAEALVRRSGRDAVDGSELRDLWQRIQDVDISLVREVEKVRLSLENQVARFSENRMKLSRYRSGMSKGPKVAKPV